MEAHISHTYTSYVIDPQVYGLDASIWKTVSGTPSVTSSKYRLNAAEIISYQQYRFGEFEFSATVPTAPAASDSRSFGLQGKAIGNRFKIVFEFDSAGKLRARVFSKAGTSLFNEEIPWDSSWTNAATSFRIAWSRNAAVFTVTGGSGVTYSTTYSSGVNPLSGPLNISIANGNSDNLDIASIIVFHSNSSLPITAGATITSLIPGTSATSLGKAEDAPHSSGDTCVPILSKRTDSAASSAGTDGDYATVNTDANGNLWVTLGTLLSGENLTNKALGTFNKFYNSTNQKAVSVTYSSFTTQAIASSVPLTLVCVRILNTTASARYLYMNNASSISGGTAPSIAPALIPASGERVLTHVELGGNGEVFSTALTIGNSTTAATFTAGSAGDLIVTLHYVTATS